MNRLRSNPLPVVQLRDALRSDLDALPDDELLDRFARYADHPAFEVLVRRYGAMVFGVCRRVLACTDADDAFQATFLVLIRKAKTLRSGSIGPWLYGVAYRVALKARAHEARRSGGRTEATDMIPDPAEPAEVPDWLPILDTELANLPAKYRDPLVLCELQGTSRADAAKQLGVPEGTLSSRLARGRELLRKRLLKHGTLLPAGGLTALFDANAGRATVPGELLTKTCELGTTPAGAVPVGAARLTDEVLKGMFLTKLRLAGGALALCVLAAVGLGAALSADTPDTPEPKGTGKQIIQGAVPPAPKPLAVGFVDKDTARPDRDAMQGLWVLEKMDIGGVRGAEHATREMVGKMRFLVAGDVWWGMIDGQHDGLSPMRIKLDPTKNPKWIDMDNLKDPDGIGRCIYELDGDKLRICASNASTGPRPAEFNIDEDAPLVVMALRRDKLPPAAGEKALIGSWQQGDTKAKRPVDGPQPARIEVLDGYIFMFLAEGPNSGSWIGGKYTVDTTKNPKWIDIDLIGADKDSRVTKLHGCYAVGEQQLTLALGTTGKRALRPLEFKSDKDVLFFEAKATPEPLTMERTETPKPKKQEPPKHPPAALPTPEPLKDGLLPQPIDKPLPKALPKAPALPEPLPPAPRSKSP